MLSLIFVNNDYITTHENWDVDLAATYDGDRLYPYRIPNSLADKEHEIDKYKNRKDFDYIRAVYLAMLGSLPNFRDVNIPELLDKILVELNLFEFNDDQLITFYRALYYLFNNLKPQVIYGQLPKFFEASFNLPYGNINRDQFTASSKDIKRDLEVILWVYNIAENFGNFIPHISNLRRTAYPKKSILKFCDRNKCTIEEEFILRFMSINVKSSLDYLLKEIRSRFQSDYIAKVFRDYAFYSMDTINSLIIDPLNIALNIYLQSETLDAKYYIKPYKIEYSFTGKQLFNALFTDIDLTLSQNWDKIEKYPTKTPFQIFDIVINSGTTEEYIPSILSELTQNSIDAMRKNNTYDYINITTNMSDNILTFQDNVGIEPKDLIYLLIPFFIKQKR